MVKNAKRWVPRAQGNAFKLFVLSEMVHNSKVELRSRLIILIIDCIICVHTLQ